MQHNDLTPNDFIKNGDAYFLHKLFPAAIEQYTHAIIKTPIGSNANLVHIYNNRGSAYFYSGNFNMAIADFSKAIRLDPNNASLRNNRSNAYIANNQLDKALLDIQDAMFLIQNKQFSHLSLNDYANQISVLNNSLFNHSNHQNNQQQNINNEISYRP